MDASLGTIGEHKNSHTNSSFCNDDGSIAKEGFEEIQLNEYENNNGKIDLSATPRLDSSSPSTEIDSASLPPVPFFKLFKYASRTDKILILIAIISSMIGGLSIPCMIILFGDLANSFVSNDLNKDLCQYAIGCCSANLT